MPHGAPDWSKYRRESLSYSVQDLAELAVRLGSPSSFDRCGDTLWFDDFEHGLRGWIPDQSGDDSSVTVSPTNAKFGGYSIKLYSDGTLFHFGSLQRNTAYTEPGKLGLEASFTLDANTERIKLSLGMYDGDDFSEAIINYRHDTHLITLGPLIPPPTTLATGIYLHEHTSIWHTIKLVVDFINGRYHRLVLDNYHYNLTAHDLDIDSAPTVDPYLYTQIRMYGLSGEVSTSYIDGYIITIDEP